MGLEHRLDLTKDGGCWFDHWRGRSGEQAAAREVGGVTADGRLEQQERLRDRAAAWSSMPIHGYLLQHEKR